MSKTLIGTQIKLSITLTCGTATMDDMEFSIDFFTSAANKITLSKSQLIREDANEYIAIIDTAELSSGSIQMKVTCRVPDEQISGGWRTEIGVADTGVKVQK